MKNGMEQCEDLIKQWCESPVGDGKNQIRNQLFLELKPFLCKWILSILSKKGRHLTEEEVNSTSWDCFEYCLRHFKPGRPIPLPNHFYTYTKFKLITFLRIDPTLMKTEEIKENLSGLQNKQYDDESLFLVYEHLEELKGFRALLPSEYMFVFDDAIMSLVPDNRQRLQRIDTKTLSYVRYQESKRILKIVVEFLLMR
jgi:hypothetical protein